MKTLSLSTLYKYSYLKKDFKAPYSSKLCSIDNSWVKVRKENDDYRYYVFLDCGFLKSSVDHRGPQIKLVGKNELTINLGEEFNDPGVSSVVDDSDGKLDNSIVTVKGDVDVNKAGTYEITYSAFDSFNNKSEVVRTVNVVKVLSGIVKNDLGELRNYSGNPNNNFVRLSNMVFRIFGLTEDDDVVLVAEDDVANVNYIKIEKWLDEVYMNHFTDEAKRLAETAKQAFYEGLKFAKEGNRVGDISHAVETYVRSQGFNLVREFQGHGIGKEMHEDPNVPNYGTPGRGMRLINNMTIAIEPMITLGTYKVWQLEDGWTIETQDGKPASHYENSLWIKEDGIEILSLTREENEAHGIHISDDKFTVWMNESMWWQS